MSKYVRPTGKRRMKGHEPHVVTALRRKYAELKGWRDVEAMDYVGRTLLLFKPDEDLAAIVGVKARTREREEWLRDALTLLRQSPVPLSARTLAMRILRSRGEFTAQDINRAQASIHESLTNLEGDGVVRVGIGRPKRWRVTSLTARGEFVSAKPAMPDKGPA